ncbi:MAG TPA: efflux RND transporter permease subunit [Myxococcaceae bacterium]|nr:efflux RND transporter permease subunit [Myxococcaceae bacterium]
MWIVRLALRRPYTVAVFSALIFIAGLLSVTRMRTDIFPSIDIPVVIVVWNYPGLSAEDMERRIVLISERAYSTVIDGITHIESQSIAGVGLLKLYFEPEADLGTAISQITSVSLTASRIMPPGIQPPNVLRFNAGNVPVAQINVSSQTAGEQQLFDYGLNFLRVRLFTIPGTSIPGPYGGKQRQIMVDVDPSATAAKGLSPQDVVTALLQSNVIIPAGTAQIGSTEYNVKLNSSPSTVDQFNSIPVKVVNGAPVLLRDVASVRDGFAVQQNIVHIDGKRASYIVILKHSNAGTLAVVDGVRGLLPSLQASAPDGIALKLDFDQSIFVRAALTNVLHEAVISSILVSLMILFFLGSFRSVAIVSSSIPLAILVGIAALFVTGNTLNLMTLGGLALAIGMLVDDATVAVESIHRNRTGGKRLTVAILDGAHEVATPALAATLTICIVFFPVVLLTGPARYLFTPLAVAVVFSMLASYVLSRTLVPALARLLESEDAHAETEGSGLFPRFNRWRDDRFGRFQSAYGRLLEVALHHRVWMLCTFGLVVLVSAALPAFVGLDFFPEVDAGLMRLHFRAPMGTRITDTERLVLEAERKIREIIPAHELEGLNDNIGIPLSYNLAFVSTDNIGPQDAEILISLKSDHRPTREYMRRIREELPKAFPGSSLYFQPADIVTQVLNFGLPAPIDVVIESNNLESGFAVGRQLAARMRRIPGVVDVRIPQVLDYPTLNLDVDRLRAAQVGLTQRDVANNLLTSLSSSSLVNSNFWLSPQNNVNYLVAVQTPLPLMRSTSDLLATPLTAPGSQPIRQTLTRGLTDAATPSGSLYLGTFAQLSPGKTLASINHSTIQRVINVQAAAEGRDLGSVAREIQKAIDALHDVPKGIKISIRGQIESMRTSFSSLGVGLILAVVLVYLLMVVLFQSWLDPFIILAAVPGALVGILWMLAVTGTTLNVESFMGAIMAVGIAVSNSILLVSYANEVRGQRQLGPLEAALEAGKVRLRPVLMTALAMVLGMLPMALALGEGGEQNAPLGRAVIGGLLVATFVTLFIVPVVYSVLRGKEPRAHRLDERFLEESQGAHPGALA